MTHDDLVALARKWLWKKCIVVVTEMKISYENEIVDAIGWDWSGWSTMIECKISRVDFLREKRKQSRKRKDSIGDMKYYLMPKGLIKPEELPNEWGLLECVDRKRSPRVSRLALRPNPADINPKHGKEILLLLSCLRRIGGLREGISVRCYQFHSKNRATLGIAEDKGDDVHDAENYRN